MATIEDIKNSKIKYEKFKKLLSEFRYKIKDVCVGDILTDRNLALDEEHQDLYVVVGKNEHAVDVKYLSGPHIGTVEIYSYPTYSRFIVISDIQKIVDETEEWWKTKF